VGAEFGEFAGIASMTDHPVLTTPADLTAIPQNRPARPDEVMKMRAISDWSLLDFK